MCNALFAVGCVNVCPVDTANVRVVWLRPCWVNRKYAPQATLVRAYPDSLILPQIILATCHTSGGRQLRYHDFDIVLIDEATQALEAVSS